MDHLLVDDRDHGFFILPRRRFMEAISFEISMVSLVFAPLVVVKINNMIR